MQRLQVKPAEVAQAANEAGEAAATARGRDAASCLSGLEAALPGSETAGALAALRADWAAYTHYWVRQAEDYSAALHEAATTYAASDDDASSYLETTLGNLESVPEPS